MSDEYIYLHTDEGGTNFAFASGITGNLGLAVLKLLTALLWSSRLFAMDGLYSFVNAVVFLLPWQAATLKEKTASARHPYGVTKLLFIGMLAIGAMYLFAAVPAFLYVLRPGTRFQAGRSDVIPIVVAVISIIGNELLYRRALSNGRGGTVASVRWVALNNRGGVVVSTLVLLSLFCSRLGMANFAIVFAVAASAPVVLTGLRMLSAGFNGVMDRTPTPRAVAQIASCADKVDEVQRVVDVNVRHLGRGLHLDVWVALEEDLEMSQVERVAHEIKERLRSRLPEARFINVIVA